MKKIVVAGSLYLLPVIALAQFGEVNTFIGKISTFINGTLIPLLFGVALLMFLWGVFQYFIQGGADEEKQAKGRQLMIYSIVGFVLMVSVFGIVNLIADGLGFSKEGNIQNIPNVPTNNS
jgi:cytochrome bd-type quinol oxidase subunit 2